MVLLSFYNRHRLEQYLKLNLHLFPNHLKFLMNKFSDSNESTNQMQQLITEFIVCRLDTALRYRSTCFGHPHAHHQETINCSSSSCFWFTLGTWWQQFCCPWSVWSDRPRPRTLLSPRSYGKPEAAAAAAVDSLLMMGIRMPETC